MTAALVRPLPFSVVSGSAKAIAPLSNLNTDHPAIVWQSVSLTGVAFVIDLGANAVAYDTVALIGTNLRGSDSLVINTGTTTTGTGSSTTSVAAVWSGPKSDLATAKVIVTLPTTRTERYMRITATATGHADGCVQASRLVIGKSVVTLGVEVEAEHGFEDYSNVSQGAGYTTVEPYDSVAFWKVNFSAITDIAWRTDWLPLIQWMGAKRGVLFIPELESPDKYQTQAIFGRSTNKISGKYRAHDWVELELSMVALGV
jgi:hypothetical protein